MIIALNLDGTMQGAGGVGGLLAVVREDGAYIPTYDANGNVSEYVSAADGTVAAHYDCSPFGEQLVASGPLASVFTHRFSTKPYCQTTGFCEYQMRKYNPNLERWMSRDPIGEEGGVNFYVFSLNAPLYDIDLLGLLDCDRNNEGARQGLSIKTVFSPGERNPDDVKGALDTVLTILILNDIPFPKLSDTCDLVNKLNPMLPWGMDVAAVALELSTFDKLLRLTAGVATIWTKVQCQECRCTNLFTGWPFHKSESDFAWGDIGDEYWHKCDLKKTKWGSAQQKMPGGSVKMTGGGVMFEMLTAQDVESIRTQCDLQVSESCGK